VSIRIEKDGAITTVIIARADKRNAIDRESADGLAAAFREFEADEAQKIAVLWGEGGHFCAGADLKAIAEGNANRVEPDGDGPLGPTRMSLEKPVIAAIEGYAVAGGLELALWCDLRVAASDSTLGVFCRRFGVPLIDGGTVRLPRLIGLSRALDLILTGRPVKADEALSFGLVNRVVPSGTTREAATQLAKEIAAFPQLCMKIDRRSAYEAFDGDLETRIEREIERGVQALGDEGIAGAAEFVKGAGKHGAF
jgi:enoyl-CoA hydratase